MTDDSNVPEEEFNEENLELAYQMQSINETQEIFEAIADLLDLPDDYGVAGVACTAHLLDPNTNHSYYEAFVIPEPLSAHEKLGLMSFGEMLAQHNMDNVKYQDFIVSESEYDKDIETIIAEAEVSEKFNSLIEECFNLRKPVLALEIDENVELDGDPEVIAEIEEAGFISQEVADRVLNEASMLIHIVNLEEKEGLFAYKAIPTTAHKHSQLILWREGKQFIIENDMPI